MTTLAADTPRDYDLGNVNELPVVASDIIYEGAAVGENASGYSRPLVAGDPFQGFALSQADNSSGSAGTIKVKVQTKGKVRLTVAGATAITANDFPPVYASDDNTFTLTKGSNTLIGNVHRWIASTDCIVSFDAPRPPSTVGTSDLEADCVDGTKIADDAIDSEHIADGAIDLAHMSANSIDSDQYVDGSIDLAHLSADCVDGTKIADDAIDSEHIADGAIDLAHMSANSIDSDQYVDGSIDTAHLAADAIDGTLIADDAVDSEHIADGAIDLAHMSANSIDSDQYVDGSIDLAHLSADCVDGTKIADNAVSLEHLDSGITPSHICVFAGEFSWSGGGASKAQAVAGALDSDIVVCTIQSTPTEAAYIAQAVLTTDTLTVTLSAANTSNDAVIAYQIMRAAA